MFPPYISAQGWKFKIPWMAQNGLNRWVCVPDFKSLPCAGYAVGVARLAGGGGNLIMWAFLYIILLNEIILHLLLSVNSAPDSSKSSESGIKDHSGNGRRKEAASRSCGRIETVSRAIEAEDIETIFPVCSSPVAGRSIAEKRSDEGIIQEKLKQFQVIIIEEKPELHSKGLSSVVHMVELWGH